MIHLGLVTLRAPYGRATLDRTAGRADGADPARDGTGPGPGRRRR